MGAASYNDEELDFIKNFLQSFMPRTYINPTGFNEVRSRVEFIERLSRGQTYPTIDTPTKTEAYIENYR